MRQTELPMVWQQAMQRTGLTSLRRLSDRAGVAPETARRLMLGIGNPAPDTVRAVAEALGEDVRVVAQWANQSRSVVEPYRPPAEADLLTERQRAALDELIRSMTLRGDTSNGAPTTTPTGRAALAAEVAAIRAQTTAPERRT